MDNFIITLTFLLIGVLIRRVSVFPEETGNILNLFVIYISLPALILLKIPELSFSRHLLAPALTPWGMLLISSLSILFLSRLLKWDRPTTGCLLLLIPLGNTSFLGIPMVKAFFGDQAVPYALLYDQLGSYLALATYGSLIIALYGTGAGQPTVQSVIKKIITFPPFIALVFALVLRPLQYSPLVVNILQTLSSTLVPVVLIAVGFQLVLRLDRQVTSQLCIGLSIKLIAAPMAALLFYKLIGLNGTTVQVSIFEAGMPPMVSAGALAILARLSPPLTAALVGIGIVVSFATLPVIFQFI